MSTFREPTIELPQPFYLSSGRIMLSTEEPVDLLVPDAEALLEVLLDICPNAHALAGARNYLTSIHFARHVPSRVNMTARLLARGTRATALRACLCSGWSSRQGSTAKP